MSEEERVINKLVADNKALHDLVDWQAADNKRLHEALHDIIAIPNSEAAQGIMKAIARAALGEGKE